MVLDSDVVIVLEQRRQDTEDWFNALPATPFISGYAAMEVLAVCQNTADRRRIERLLRPFSFLWPDESALNHALVTFGALRLAHGIGVLDMLIATTAMAHGMPLATYNSKHYRNVPGLLLVQPAKENSNGNKS